MSCIVVGCKESATVTTLAGGKPAWCQPHLSHFLSLTDTRQLGLANQSKQLVLF